MNEHDTDKLLRQKLKSQHTELPNGLEERIMNTIQTANRKKKTGIILIPIAAALLVVAGVLAGTGLLNGNPPAPTVGIEGGGIANGSELTQNFKEYNTVAEAEAALGIDILEPGYAPGGAALAKVTVYFAGSTPNSVSLEYGDGGASAYLVSQSTVSDADGQAFVESWEKMQNPDGSQFYEKAMVGGLMAYLLPADGGYNAEMVKGQLYLTVGSLEQKLSKEDVVKLLESLK